MNWKVHRYAVVDSTMTIAASLPLGAVVVAAEQTSGIGRHGHSWESQAGAGLYCSLVLEPRPVLTLALGLAAAEAIQRVTSIACDIRWPNDLMLGEKKFGGILVQIQDDRAIAGIGINVGQRRFPPDLAPIATSLAIETGLEFRADDLLDALLASVPGALRLSRGAVIESWEKASTYASGKRVAVDMGDRTITGVTSGLDASGFLRVRTAQGVVETVLAGGVRPV